MAEHTNTTSSPTDDSAKQVTFSNAQDALIGLIEAAPVASPGRFVRVFKGLTALWSSPLPRRVMPAVVALASPASAADRSPDAELIALCVEFDRLERSFRATNFTSAPNTPEDEAADAERARIVEEQDKFFDRIIDHRATTMEGHVARARSLAGWDAELLKDKHEDVGDWMTMALVRDLIGAAV